MAAMIAVKGGILLNRCFFDILERRLLRLTSFFGLDGSCWASCSWMRKLAISEHALRYLSFSGGRFKSLGSFLCFSSTVMTSVAIFASFVIGPLAHPQASVCDNQKTAGRAGEVAVFCRLEA